MVTGKSLFDITFSLVYEINGYSLIGGHMRQIYIIIQKMQNSFWKTFASVSLYRTQPWANHWQELFFFVVFFQNYILRIFWTIIVNPSYEGRITKTYLYNFDPLKPLFYTVKRGFTGVYIIFLFLLKNIDCGYSLEPPRFWAEIWKKNIIIFISFW